jgi:L-rhamnose mutarotase
MSDFHSGAPIMARVAFKLRLRPDRIKEYEDAHRRVWPELLELLKDSGIERYSIFRWQTDLFFYMQVEDFDQAWSRIERSHVNKLWQRDMESLFECTNDLSPGERFPMMKEVFYLD